MSKTYQKENVDNNKKNHSNTSQEIHFARFLFI